MSLVRKLHFILVLLCTTILFSTTFSLAQEPQEGRLMRFPDIHGNKIVFIYVEDLARALLAALESPVKGEVFQISAGTETSIQTLSELIEAVVGQKVNSTHIEARAGDVRRNYSLIAKATMVLGWKPQVSLEDGLRRTYEWRLDWKSRQ